MLGSLILYLKGMRTIMFQLSGCYPNTLNSEASVNALDLCSGVVSPGEAGVDDFASVDEPEDLKRV